MFGKSNLSVRANLLELARATERHLAVSAADCPTDMGVRNGFVQDLATLELSRETRFTGKASVVRGLRHAPVVLDQMPGPGLKRLHAAAVSAFGHMRWSEFYAPDDWSSGFLADFANGEGIGPDGRIGHTSLILGLFLMGPNILYPAHAHPAEEFYLVLSGEPAFQVGADAPFKPQPDGAVVWHPSNVSHAIRTNDSPMFAVFGWRGEIDEASWYRDDMKDDSLPIRRPTIAKG